VNTIEISLLDGWKNQFSEEKAKTSAGERSLPSGAIARR
jgi:hypothetical protein